MRRRALLTILAGLAVSALGITGVQAATFTVANLNDSGVGSLRQAVLDANAAAGADVITFQDGLNGTITLTSGLLPLSDDVEIQGPGAASLTVSGNNASRVFYVSSFNALSVTIRGLTITRGSAHGNESYGGSMLIETEGSLTLVACVVSHSSADAYGGGIYNQGRLTLINSTVSGNDAGIAGGAIFNEAGTLTLTGCNFSGNRTTDETFARGGGAIDSESGTLTADRCTFSSNSSKGSGGGIFAAGVTATLDVCALNANDAVYGGGGIVSGGGGTLRMNDCGVAGNSAGLIGGGIWILGNGSLTLTSSTLSNNQVTDPELSEGGGLFTEGSTRAAYCVFAGNEAIRAGGGIFNGGEMTLASSTLSANGTDGAGGGIGNLGNLAVTDCTLSGNRARLGGGISSDDGTVTLTHCTLFANLAASGLGDPSLTRGGGIDNHGASRMVVRNCTIAGNSAVAAAEPPIGFGGGIFNSSELTVQSSTINGNISINGGGICNQPPVIIEGPAPQTLVASVTLENSTLSRNQAFMGGGILNQGDVLLANCTLSGNLAEANQGGGIRGTGGALEMGNTIVAHSGAGLNGVTDPGGFINSRGHNLDSDGTCNLGKSGDQSGTIANPLDPRLGPLQNNGGPTQTHALLGGSPAIDTGDGSLAPANTDQRGFARIVDGDRNGTRIIDIGAFELNPRDLGLGVGGFLSILSVQEPSVQLPSGSTAFDLILHYSADIIPETFVAILNGQNITDLFDPVADAFETVSIPLRAGPNRLVIRVRGTRDGQPAEDVQTLGFSVGQPPFGPR